MSKIIYIPAPASSSGFVPYTGATASVNLSSSYYLYARNFKTLGTLGYGHYSATHQSAGILAGANESNLYADVNGNLAWQNSTLYRNVFSTNANTANRVYTFFDKDYTVADDATKLNISVSTTSGTVIRFTTDLMYGTTGAPETGNITANTTGAQTGVTGIIIHNSGTAPTFSAAFKKLSGSGSYVTGTINYIYCTYIDSTHIIYSINQ